MNGVAYLYNSSSYKGKQKWVNWEGNDIDIIWYLIFYFIIVSLHFYKKAFNQIYINGPFLEELWETFTSIIIVALIILIEFK